MKRNWFFFAAITMVSWGIWGALMEFPEKIGFPATLGYTTWVITMIPCSLIALWLEKWKLDYDLKSVVYGSLVGLSGAGGQLILFHALKEGPAYIIFPVVSLYPVITVFLSTILLDEKTIKASLAGIFIAIIAILLLSYQVPKSSDTRGYLWLLLAVLISVSWGVQAFVIKIANERMSAESIFFYMMATGILLVPIAISMTNFSLPINFGLTGPYLSLAIQVLNSVGALSLVYALRYGKAIVVVPMTALAPVITIIISLVLYHTIPHTLVFTGLIMAIVSIFLLSKEQ